jgi:DNA-binding response OmpR family regulator
MVLVIDDDRDLRRAIRATLTADRYEVTEAEGAEAGLQLAHRHLPDLVICDLYLRQGCGLDVLAELRRNPASSTTPLTNE